MSEANSTFQSDYDQYLRSEQWRVRRTAILLRDKWKCRLCASKQMLTIHHNTYENLGHEPEEDLITLCKRCHDLYHELIDPRTSGIPTPKVDKVALPTFQKHPERPLRFTLKSGKLRQRATVQEILEDMPPQKKRAIIAMVRETGDTRLASSRFGVRLRIIESLMRDSRRAG